MERYLTRFIALCCVLVNTLSALEWLEFEMIFPEESDFTATYHKLAEVLFSLFFTTNEDS